MSGLKTRLCGEVGMKQGRLDKRKEKIRMKTTNKMRNRSLNDDRRGREGKLQCYSLKEVTFETKIEYKGLE